MVALRSSLNNTTWCEREQGSFVSLYELYIETFVPAEQRVGGKTQRATCSKKSCGHSKTSKLAHLHRVPTSPKFSYLLHMSH